MAQDWSVCSLDRNLFSSCCNHRNLRTRRRMHLCMQDYKIAWKFTGLAPADTARLPHFLITKIVLVVNDLVCQLGLHQLWTCLALLCQGNRPFFTKHSPSLYIVLRFLWLQQRGAQQSKSKELKGDDEMKAVDQFLAHTPEHKVFTQVKTSDPWSPEPTLRPWVTMPSVVKINNTMYE
jgi:hypothetical protein